MAVGLVLLRHAWPATFPGAGVVGVTMFFALSGYLITGILVREFGRTGGLSYARFYRNRALRLLPALAVLLTVFAAVEMTTDRLGDRALVPASVLTAVAYAADVPGLDLSPGLAHLWTLAVEEQFYLVWPTLLLLGLRRGRVGTLLSAAATGTLALCVLSTLALHPVARAYTLPTSWAVTLLVGAAVRLYQQRVSVLATRPAMLVAVALLAACCAVPDAKDRPATSLLGGPLIAAATAVLILRGRDVDMLPAALRPLRVLGVVSYATYLWNYLVVNWLQPGRPDELTGWAPVLSVVLTLALAAASWYLVESHALRLKERLDGRAPAHRHRRKRRGHPDLAGQQAVAAAAVTQ